MIILNIIAEYIVYNKLLSFFKDRHEKGSYSTINISHYFNRKMSYNIYNRYHRGGSNI